MIPIEKTMRATLARRKQYVIDDGSIFRVVPDGDDGASLFDETKDAAEVLDALLTLPVDLRRALYTLITQDFADSFNGAPYQKSTRTHPWPPRSRR